MSEFSPRIGEISPIAPAVRRIVAPNPSPMTFRGTNTYIVGTTHLAVIDPGPHDTTHLRRIIAAIGDGRLQAILVTHAHLDHSPLARLLSKITGAPVMAYGDAASGQSPIMRELAKGGTIGGGEGIDHEFDPDVYLSDGEVIQTNDFRITAHHTPGHMANHMCFQWDDLMFTGDVVMGWSTSLVSPPDGDMGQFMASLDRLESIPSLTYFPGHGAPVDDPHERVRSLRDHRLMREAAIVDALRNGPMTVETLTEQIYSETPRALWPAAGRNILAHLIGLFQTGQITTDAAPAWDAEFHLIPEDTLAEPKSNSA